MRRESNRERERESCDWKCEREAGYILFPGPVSPETTLQYVTLDYDSHLLLICIPRQVKILVGRGVHYVSITARPEPYHSSKLKFSTSHQLASIPLAKITLIQSHVTSHGDTILQMLVKFVDTDVNCVKLKKKRWIQGPNWANKALLCRSVQYLFRLGKFTKKKVVRLTEVRGDSV